MKAKIKVRNSSYELMRIISMFLIVLDHVILHGKLLTNCTNPIVVMILRFILFLTLVHVNSFILLTGYFQSKSSFKQSNLWSIINANWFYRIVIMIIFLSLGMITVNKVTFIKEVLPLNLNEYWFVQCYLLLYCMTPFINKCLSAFDKKDFQRLLIVMFIIFSILPPITGLHFFDNDSHTLYHFIFLYIIGAYLRRYPLDKSYLFKKMSNNLYQIVLIIIFFTALCINFINYNFFSSISHISPVMKEFAGYIVDTAKMYNNPLIMIQSIAYFAFFGTFVINSKIINKIASLTLGVYLIHDNSFVRKNLYTILKVNSGPVHSYKVILYALVISIIIYLGCMLIEFIRKIIFKFIYNLKISERIRKRYYTYINNIHIMN